MHKCLSQSCKMCNMNIKHLHLLKANDWKEFKKPQNCKIFSPPGLFSSGCATGKMEYSGLERTEHLNRSEGKQWPVVTCWTPEWAQQVGTLGDTRPQWKQQLWWDQIHPIKKNPTLHMEKKNPQPIKPTCFQHEEILGFPFLTVLCWGG